MLTVLENCRVSSPLSTVGDKSLPLTFFDAIWLLFFPISQVFFYELPHPKSYFLETIVPKLKHSLSITLQHFFPFAGNLIVIPNPNRCFNGKKPEIHHVEGDSVTLTFAEYELDFNELTGNHTRECHKFYPLLPLLGQPSKAWTSIAKHGTDELFLASGSLPFYERVIEYPESLDEIYFNQPGIETIDEGYKIPHLVGGTDKTRATLVLTQAHINRLKKWLSTQSPTLEYVSSFSVACAYVWSCIAKARARTGEQKGENDNDGDDDLERFIFPVDWRPRIHPPLPPNYFGNCLGPCITTLTKRSLLAGNEGFQTAAELVGKALSETLKTKDALLNDADTWLERAYEPVLMIGVSGTPKMKVYDIDFGWGKPKKHETPSIDYNGSISVNASKDSAGDIEIGISLPTKQMHAFISISRDELENTFYDQDE
ncbi:hypothetical protein L1987_58131 [Smallanthus sonchifolius]|uniref:Uncharacterized protein n=1 Tax=Smallanthus sonchifolius TaxID=185202 RepID=A0ACB9DFJ4_9ASTR|nr:hypothetical protein L1987_58131 [Smallanthus sonchifolius]